MTARRTRLVDCNPRWVVLAEGGPETGVSFACPEGHAGCRHIIPFTPRLDGTPGHSWHDGGAIWQRTGDNFETLTLSPSIRREPTYADRDAAIAAGADERYLEPTHFCALHVNLVNGTFEFCGDSR